MFRSCRFMALLWLVSLGACGGGGVGHDDGGQPQTDSGGTHDAGAKFDAETPDDAGTPDANGILPPAGLTYSANPAVYTKGQAITPNTPSSSGGAVASYTVAPTLPAGLALNGTTGVLSGTPTVLSPTTSYTVTATNSVGSTTATLSVMVDDVPPSGLTYSTNPAVYTRGQAITPNTPASSGGAVVSYTIAPVPPAGLVLNGTTGIVSGTPTALAATANYTVTASNTGGSTTAAVTITVVDLPPTGLAYSTNPAVYTRGQAITPNTPSSGGGAVVSYAVAPALPAGLALDGTTGVVSGTPTALAATVNYTVTATNSGGFATAILTLTVGGGAQAIAAGEFHTCALLLGGAAQCWGYNRNGGLGNGTTSTTATPVPVKVLGLSGAAEAIAGGSRHTCAMVSGGAFCWGGNGYGQLGNNSTTDSLVPVQVSGLTSGVVGIAAGGDGHSCALAGGGVECWGANAYGQLGNNSTTDSHVPVQVAGLTSGVAAIAVARWRHSCAVVGGGAQCWGWNAYGQLGNNSTTDSHVPVQVVGLTSGVTDIAVGTWSSCAVVNGSAQCWGGNSWGELGNNSYTASPVPVQVSGLTGGVTAIAGGAAHYCALVNGGVECWGNNTHGELGDNSTTDRMVPVQVVGLASGVAAIAAGGYHTCALLANGGVQCWGNNDSGQLGSNSTANIQPVPVDVSAWAP